jgi:hypothetical protein
MEEAGPGMKALAKLQADKQAAEKAEKKAPSGKGPPPAGKPGKGEKEVSEQK